MSDYEFIRWTLRSEFNSNSFTRVELCGINYRSDWRGSPLLISNGGPIGYYSDGWISTQTQPLCTKTSLSSDKNPSEAIRIVLLHLELVTFRFQFGKTWKPSIFMVFGPSGGDHDSRNNHVFSFGDFKWFQIVQETTQLFFGKYHLGKYRIWEFVFFEYYGNDTWRQFRGSF